MFRSCVTAMDSNGFNVGIFLQSLRTTKPPWECPKCHKFYKSYSGIEYHIVKFHHLGSSSPSTPSNKTPFHPARKSKLKYTVRKKNNRLLRRSPSPVELLSSNRDTTLTWAEAQQMVELETNGKVYRLNISDKMDIISDSDENSDNENDLANGISDHNMNNKISNDILEKAIVNGDHEKTVSPTKKNSKPAISLPVLLPKSLNNSNTSSISALPKPSFQILSDYDVDTSDAPPRPSAYYRYIEKPQDELEDEVEYDMDEEDAVWLELVNKHRIKEEIEAVTDNQLELLMDRFEKESYFEQAKNGHSAHTTQPLIDEDAVCCVCNDGECQNSNVILFCDMCNLAIHQECYGVPYIPEGQWLCRRCLQSPSSPVDCCLCPNRTGAFKQTDDGRWAHVVCALWIPEVSFGNTVFLEPIDGLKNVPPARWKLTCYICKQRNAGSCIQCHRTNCYTAFHVTCAQQAALYMKMEPVKKTGENGVTIMVKKEAYCDAHTPADASPRQKGGALQETPSVESKVTDKMKKARKLLAEKRLEAPQISIPYIPRDRLVSIGRLVNIQKRSAFMQRLLSYWTLKRQSRNGVPLLRRLQSHVHSNKPHDPKAKLEQKQLLDQLNYWQRLRHDLERARLLIELLRKREKLKREAVRTSQIITELRLFPLVVLLRRVLAKLVAVDTAKVFREPVKANDAPDYYNVIKNPMDFSTMSVKIDNQEYKTVSDFESDFNLIINNCIRYNGRDNIFYRLATRMRDHGGTAIRAAKREVARTGYDEDTGLLLLKTPEKKVEETIDEEKRLSLPLREQLDIMLVRLDQAVLRAKKTKKIRTEIGLLKRKIARENNLRKSQKSLLDKNAQEMTSCSGDDAKDQTLVANPNELANPIVSNENSEEHLRDNLPLSDQECTRARGRKRLWCERRTSSSSEAAVCKKRMLGRSGSCPIPIQKLLETDLSLCRNTSNGALSHHIMDADKTPDPTRSASLPASPTNCVNRRTAVLFNKKSRWRFSSPISTISLIKDEVALPLKEPKAFLFDAAANSESRVIKTEDAKPLTFDSIDKIIGTHVETSGNDATNFDSSQPDDEVKDEKSFQVYRDEALSHTGSESDDESTGSSDNSDNEPGPLFQGRMGVGLATPRSTSCPAYHSMGFRKSLKRSCQDVMIHLRNAYRSDGSSSEASGDERRLGLTLGDNTAVSEDQVRRNSSTSEDEFDSSEMAYMSPLDLVWAKCWGYPPYPALLIDPKMPRSGYCHNGVPIPVPPLDVLQAGEDKRRENGNRKIYLVLFFDTKRTWQWLPRNKLELLGIDSKSDEVKLAEGRRPAVRKNVVAAYKRALHHRSKVTGEIPDSDDDIIVEATNIGD